MKRGVLCIFLAILLSGCSLFLAEPTVMQTVPSPDGAYTAYIFESSGGATEGWTYHVSVLPSSQALGKGSGNIYVSGIEPQSLVWLDSDRLYVDDYDSSRTTKRKESIYGIAIQYHSKSPVILREAEDHDLPR